MASTASSLHPHRATLFCDFLFGTKFSRLTRQPAPSKEGTATGPLLLGLYVVMDLEPWLLWLLHSSLLEFSGSTGVKIQPSLFLQKDQRISFSFFPKSQQSHHIHIKKMVATTGTYSVN